MIFAVGYSGVRRKKIRSLFADLNLEIVVRVDFFIDSNEGRRFYIMTGWRKPDG